MIISLGGTKGGSGKTTVATNLAVMRSLEGKDVLLVDSDEQKSATLFSMLRSTERGSEGAGYTHTGLLNMAVRTEVLRQKHKYDDIIIDVGGRDTESQRAAMSVADLVLIPFVPRTYDVWTISNIDRLILEISNTGIDVKAYTFINRADPKGRGTDNEETEEFLRNNQVSSYSEIRIGNRKAFGNSASQGLAVTEMKHADEKANMEIKALYDFTFNFKETSQ